VLIVFGGTFDPPHVAHLVLAECARVQFAAQRVLFLPAGDPYHKRVEGRPAPAAALHRVAMTRIATQSNPAFLVDDREVRRGGPTYTVDTLLELHAEGERELALVVGADAWADLPNWKEPGRIRELARIAVAPKPGGPAPGPGAVEVAMPPLAVSSTLIRERLAAGLPVRYLLPEPVEAYIRQHGLYGARGPFTLAP